MNALVDFSKYDPFSIGFDTFTKRMEDMLKPMTNATYPPYNIVKLDENKYLIEMAVAGFGKNNLEIELNDGVMKVTGKIESDPGFNYLHKGIADRAFTRTFALADSIEVKDAQMMNGLLKIFLENIIPDHKKPKKVDIRDEDETSIKSDSQLLTEDEGARD